jgi:exonuclease VII small subunit
MKQNRIQELISLLERLEEGDNQAQWMKKYGITYLTTARDTLNNIIKDYEKN